MRIVCGGLLALLVSCTTANENKACSAGACNDPAFPYCDVEGTISGEAGTCIAVSCTPGAIEACLGDDALTCNAQGDGYEHVACDLGCVMEPTPHCAPDAFAISASPSNFVMHANDTRETKITLTNGTSRTLDAPSLQVMGLSLGTLTFSPGTCSSSLAPGGTCTATGTLTATTAGQVSFSITATTSPGGNAMVPLSANVMPACPATCSPAGTTNCCASPVVPGNATGATLAGASFFRSYDAAADTMYKDVSYPATVSDFRLDKYEVTVGRFRAFLNAGYGTQAKPPMPGEGGRTLNGVTRAGGWDASWNAHLPATTAALLQAVNCNSSYQTWTNAAGANENKPINCMTWYLAEAFCIWDGGFLPTETEWNYAAAGGSEQRVYAWSNPAASTTIDCTYANYYNATPCMQGGQLDNVGWRSKGDGRWGHSDLTGNAWEWTLDWHASPYSTATCDDCANLTDATNRVLRGGGSYSGADDVRTAFRFFQLPEEFSQYYGVRCARPL